MATWSIKSNKSYNLSKKLNKESKNNFNKDIDILLESDIINTITIRNT